MSDLEADRAVLLTRIAAYPAAEVPCRSGALPAAYWTSDDPDEQDRAAAACAGCPAWVSCAEFIEGHPDEAGTYGGVTEAWRLYVREDSSTPTPPPEPAAPTRTSPKGRKAVEGAERHGERDACPGRASAVPAAPPLATYGVVTYCVVTYESPPLSPTPWSHQRRGGDG